MSDQSHHQFLASLRQEFPAQIAVVRHNRKRDPRWNRTAEAVIILDEAGMPRREALQLLRDRGFDLPESLRTEEAAERTGYSHLSRKVCKLRRHREQQAEARKIQEAKA